MLNIDEDSLYKREVVIAMTTILFSKPQKSDSASFKRAIPGKLPPGLIVEKIVVGLFLNVEVDVQPYYVIGVKVKTDFDEAVEAIKTALYTQFYRNVPFYFVDICVEDEMHLALEKQGEIIM